MSILSPLSKHTTYLRYIFWHKFYVGVECFRHGLILRGIVHDWTKFRPGEWMAYADFFGLPEEQRKGAVKERFVMAWLRHCHVNDHHWQAWISFSDDGTWRAKEMSPRARLEMLCDWRGASRAQGKNGTTDLRDWYLERQKTIPLAPKTRAWIERQLGVQ